MDKEQRKLIWLELYRSGNLSVDFDDFEYHPCSNLNCYECELDNTICGDDSPNLTKEELEELLEEYPELKVII